MKPTNQSDKSVPPTAKTNKYFKMSMLTPEDFKEKMKKVQQIQRINKSPAKTSLSKTLRIEHLGNCTYTKMKFKKQAPRVPLDTAAPPTALESPVKPGSCAQHPICISSSNLLVSSSTNEVKIPSFESLLATTTSPTLLDHPVRNCFSEIPQPADILIEMHPYFLPASFQSFHTPQLFRLQGSQFQETCSTDGHHPAL